MHRDLIGTLLGNRYSLPVWRSRREKAQPYDVFGEQVAALFG